MINRQPIPILRDVSDVETSAPREHQPSPSATAEFARAESNRLGLLAAHEAAAKLQVAAKFLRAGGASDEVGRRIADLSMQIGSLIRAASPPPKSPAVDLLHPFCNLCGWRRGGKDSWDGNACKCGRSEPAMSAASP